VEGLLVIFPLARFPSGSVPVTTSILAKSELEYTNSYKVKRAEANRLEWSNKREREE